MSRNALCKGTRKYEARWKFLFFFAFKIYGTHYEPLFTASVERSLFIKAPEENSS